MYSQSYKKQVPGTLPSQYSELGDLVAIDGSLIDSVLSMHWAEYRTNSKKAKLHLGFDLNHGVPHKLFLTEGNGAERPFVSKLITLVRQACWIEDIKHIIYLISGNWMVVILFAG
jgi:hypothetical protein